MDNMLRTGYWSIIQTPICPLFAASFEDQILCTFFVKDGSVALPYLKQYTDMIWINQVNPQLEYLHTQINQYFQGQRQKFDLNLNVTGTPFQKKCWNYLNSIPYGKTYSYADQALGILNPKSVRACGSANGKNPFHIIVPCHRIINKDGRLGGFAAGTDIKQYLLDLEYKYK